LNDGISWSMNPLPRMSVLAVMYAGLTGCAMLPAVGLNLAVQGATGLAALTLGPAAAMQERSNPDRCSVYAGKGISVTESFETTIPTNEGEVRRFEPAYWRLELAREGYPQVERSRTPAEGSLAMSDRAVLFVPLPGATSVRIPYELVQGVEVRRVPITGEPRSMIVKSCFGRFDIVTFPEVQSGSPDTAATTAAAADLTARLAAFRETAENR
jgi:hypothetical protein